VVVLESTITPVAPWISQLVPIIFLPAATHVVLWPEKTMSSIAGTTRHFWGVAATPTTLDWQTPKIAALETVAKDSSPEVAITTASPGNRLTFDAA
jgi:hypothetical protein